MDEGHVPFQANSNNNNMKLVSAILVAALYPNVVQVLTPESKYSQSCAGEFTECHQILVKKQRAV